MRIILCKSQFMGPISGADETVVTYASQLKKAGHDPSVLLMYAHPTDEQYQTPLREAGVPVTRITDHPAHKMLARARNAARGVLRISQLTARGLHRGAEKISKEIANRYLASCRDHFIRSKADVVHVLTPDAATPVLIRASHATGIPVIYQELGTPFYSLEHTPYYERLIETLPLCMELVALSPRLAQECSEKYDPNIPVSVLPIMVEDLLNGNGHLSPAPNGKVTFGFASRFEKMKGPLTLVEAFAQMRAKFSRPDQHLAMAGSGGLAAEMETKALSLGLAEHCHWPGLYTTRKEKQSFYKSLDVFVHPSLAEGTPNCVVEAMSFGLPIVGSAIGGMPEVISPENGVLVPPGDEGALADAMARLAADPDLRVRMGRASRARYETLFAPSVVLPLMSETYERVARARKEFRGNIRSSTTNRTSTFIPHPWATEEELVSSEI